MKEKIPQDEVLQWLQDHHPTLTAVADRAWLWITADLSGPDNKPVRESIKAYGFRFAKRGHTLDTKTAYWGHSCDRPMPFRRKGKGKFNRKEQPSEKRRSISDNTTRRVDPVEQASSPSPSLDEMLAFANG